MMKLSMMTLGCPGWDLETICRRAGEYGYDGIDFRGIQGELDVTKLPAFTTESQQTVKLLSEHGLVVSGISSSICICDPDNKSDLMDEARRTMEAAFAVGTRNIRLFGGGHPDTIGYRESARIGIECVESILSLPGANQLSWNLETHDHWISSVHCKLLLDQISNPAFAVVWDLGHTRRIANEPPAQTVQALADRIRYVHVKDAVRAEDQPNAMKDGWRYVLPGEGELKLDEGVKLLQRSGYAGWLMFEHEKRWHPELEEPEIALPAFVRWAREVLREETVS